MPDGGPLLATPIVVGNYLFLLSRDGTLSCFDAGTGLPLYRQEIVPAEAPSSESEGGALLIARESGGHAVRVSGAAEATEYTLDFTRCDHAVREAADSCFRQWDCD